MIEGMDLSPLPCQEDPHEPLQISNGLFLLPTKTVLENDPPEYGILVSFFQSTGTLIKK